MSILITALFIIHDHRTTIDCFRSASVRLLPRRNIKCYCECRFDESVYDDSSGRKNDRLLEFCECDVGLKILRHFQ